MDDDYFGDVVYEVWRSGGDVDSIDRDRVEDHQDQGCEYEEAAAIELEYQKHLSPFERLVQDEGR